MADFVPGMTLSGEFFAEAVRPILTAHFPALSYGAALIGPGSEVLGFDTPMSADHDWGLRVFLFLREADFSLSAGIASVLSHELPHTFRGRPVAIATLTTTSRARGMECDATTEMDGPVKHHVVPTTVRRFCAQQLGCIPETPAQWLSIPSHALAEVVAGAVYLDDTGEITELRQRLAWYPRDVHLYVLASGWQRIGNEEHLLPRVGHVGSELGAGIIAGRLARDVMHLAFLMEKTYAPYAKWLGSAFGRLKCAGELEPLLKRLLEGTGWEERQRALGEACEVLARMHTALGLTREVMRTEVARFHDRPWDVIHGEIFAQALVEEIEDEVAKALARRSLIGSVSQWSDNVAMEHVNIENIQGIYQ